MSGTLFSKTPRRDSPQPTRVATPNEAQEDRSAPPPPSEEAWLCDEPHKYRIKSSNKSSDEYNEILERHDKDTYTQLKEEINFLMVVAGLFLAIVAAFTIESYKFLQEDKQDTMSDLLVEVVRLLNDTSAQGTAQLPKPFTPKHHAIVVNQLWFLSMILSLIAVAMGTFCLQWISALSRGSDLTANDIPFHKSLALRHLRHDGLDGWGVRYAPEALLFIVQLSIGLFVCGLVYFLWNVSERTAIPTLVMTGIAATSLCLINSLPSLQPLVGAFLPATLNASQCPYKSPTSWFVYNAGIVLLHILRRFLCLLPCGWVELPQSLRTWSLRVTGFDWKTYDETMQRLRTNVRSELSYFESGLISALDRFPYEGEARDIVFSYLESLVPYFGSTQEWETSSQQNLSSDEKCFLDDKFTIALDRLPRRLNTTSLQMEYAVAMRSDFLGALILQHLTQHHKRLASQLLYHRVELYIRVKKSTEFIFSDDGSRLGFGRSLGCPFGNGLFSIVGNIGRLDLGLKYQFLRCVRHLIDTRRFDDLDIISAAVIVRSEMAHLMPLSQKLKNQFGTQLYILMNPPAEEERTGPLPNQSSPRNIHIGNFSNQADPGTTSSPLNDLETGGPESATHNTSAEGHPSRASFESLSLEVKKQLLRFRQSEFNMPGHYSSLRYAFDLPLEPEPESVRTHTSIDVPEHEGT